MPNTPLAGCYVISLRPVGDHAVLRRVAAAHGAHVLALSPWKRVQRDDASTRRALRAALACDRVVFASPFAVRAARNLQPLRAPRGRHWFAVGTGTASALRRAGLANVHSPQRMDSEGLLDLPELRALEGSTVGVVTAPGGRGAIVAGLRARGATVVRADVYERRAVTISPRAVATLLQLDAPTWLALSSADALQHVLNALPCDAVACLRRARVMAGSARLQGLARFAGFERVDVAASARPQDLVQAMASASMAAPVSHACAPAHGR